MKYTSFDEVLGYIHDSNEALSTADAALLLDILQEMPSAVEIRQRCYKIVQEYCRGDWLQKSSLRDLVIVVGVLYKYYEFDSGQLAIVVKRLLDAESQVGGPYRNERGEVETETNVAVSYFARMTGISLPRVEEYMCQKGSLSLSQQYMAYGKVPDRMQMTDESVVAAALALLSPRRTDKKIDASIKDAGLYSEITQGVEAQLETLGQPLQAAAYAVYEKIRRADKNKEIALMPAFFGECVKGVSDASSYGRLGRANFYIWMAYTVYDDFLDAEGKPEYLPVAHMAVREAFRQYAPTVGASEQFSEIFAKVLTGMDEANTWEVKYCRLQVADGQVRMSALPKYGQRIQLAARSFAHALGPLALVAERWSLTSREARYVQDGFKHYLIARQLDDDAHDWLEDMKSGQVSFVVAHILRQLRVRPGVYELDELLNRMKRDFWRYSAVQICDMTLRHIQLAREAFNASGIVELSGQFAGLLTKIEDSARQTHARQESERKFMDVYKTFDVE